MSTDVILFLFFSIAAAFVYRHIPVKTRRPYLLAVNAVFYMENVHLSYEGRLEFLKILSDIDL